MEVGSDRYQDALANLVEQAALLGYTNMISDDDVGLQHPHGYLSHYFIRRALVMLDG